MNGECSRSFLQDTDITYKRGENIMGYIIFMIVLISSMVVSKLIFRPSIGKIKALKHNEELEKITSKLPEDIVVAEEILDMIEAKKTNFTRPKVEQAKDTELSLYIGITNKIILADFKNNYARIQTIVHECIHSSQNRLLVIFNFIITNINMILVVVLSLLAIFNVINLSIVTIVVFMATLLLQFSVRTYLEVDAIKKARMLTEEYLDNKISTGEKRQLLQEYDKINALAMPFVIDYYYSVAMVMIVIYTIVRNGAAKHYSCE